MKKSTFLALVSLITGIFSASAGRAAEANQADDRTNEERLCAQPDDSEKSREEFKKCVSILEQLKLESRLDENASEFSAICD